MRGSYDEPRPTSAPIEKVRPSWSGLLGVGEDRVRDLLRVGDARTRTVLGNPLPDIEGDVADRVHHVDVALGVVEHHAVPIRADLLEGTAIGDLLAVGGAELRGVGGS